MTLTIEHHWTARSERRMAFRPMESQVSLHVCLCKLEGVLTPTAEAPPASSIRMGRVTGKAWCAPTTLRIMELACLTCERQVMNSQNPPKNETKMTAVLLIRQSTTNDDHKRLAFSGVYWIFSLWFIITVVRLSPATLAWATCAPLTVYGSNL